MVGIGIGVTWIGYAALYYGISQIQGGNWGFLDLCLPSRWTPAVAGIIKDSGGAAAKAPTPSVATSSTDQKVKAGVPKNVVKSPAISYRPTPGR